jgi:hypothetical protein
VLALKTHGFHWNVTGAMFPMLHALFEEQYTALAAASDHRGADPGWASRRRAATRSSRGFAR